MARRKLGPPCLRKPERTILTQSGPPQLRGNLMAMIDEKGQPPTHSPPDHQGVVRSELVQHLGQRGPGIQGTAGGDDEHQGSSRRQPTRHVAARGPWSPVETRAYARR